MADRTATLERDDGQPQQQQQQQEESFDSTKRFHIAFISFKLLVIKHFNSKHTGALSHAVLQFYIICEAIYLVALIKVTEPASRNPIYRYLYIIFGTLNSELLLWTSLSMATWLVVNMCLLVFALICSDCFCEIVQLLEDVPLSEVRLEF